VARALVQLWPRIRDIGFDGESEPQLAELERRYEELTVPKCEAAKAPTVSQDPDWETRVLEEFEEIDIDIELEDFMSLRSEEPDCERCPYASPYSLFPMDPCEFSAGALEEILLDAELADVATRAMDQAEMVGYAQRLEDALNANLFQEHTAVHSEDYIEKAVAFLRFWSGLGFSLQPALLDERIEELAEIEDDDDEDDAPTVH